jgi:hypothetical protein
LRKNGLANPCVLKYHFSYLLNGHLGLRNEIKLVLSFISIIVLLGFSQVPIQDAEAASKVTICHNGDTKEFPEAAVASHLAHGDTEGACPDDIISTSQGSNGFSASNFNQLPKVAVGGELIPIETTMVLVAGAQYSMAWMIPVIVSGIGIAIVIARKF